MVVKSAIILLAAIILAIAESPPEFQVASGYQVGRPPYRVRQQSGASKIFGWLGSRFAKIPYFLPRVQSYPKYAPHQHLQQLQPQYQSQNVILPELPAHSTPEPQAQSVPDQGPIEQYNNIETESNPLPPVYVSPSPNEIPVDNNHNKAHGFKDHFEVVPSQLLSYEKEVMPPVEGGWQPGFGGIPFPTSPIPSPPLQHNQQGSNQIPVVPQSMGPDYFNTAYGHENNENQQQQLQYQSQQQQAQQNPQYNFQAPVQSTSSSHQSNQQSYEQPNNFGATFGEIQQQPAQYLGSSSSPIGQQVAQPSQQNGYSSASFDFNQADFSSLLSSIGSSGQNIVGSDGFNVQGSHVVPVTTKPPKKPEGSQPSQKSDGYVASGIPGVQILSQTDDGGNPVFEVLADADAPSFGGHPFDINKLIAMIEPGAELVDAPQLSQASSETKNVYAPAPAQATSGTSDLLLSESDPEPSHTSAVDGSKTKKPFSSFFSTHKNDSDKNKSSLKEIMEFFQQTGGKGYVVVEKKRSPQTLTDALTPDDDLTDGFSRLNITSETLPLLELDKETGNPLKYSIIPHGSSTVGTTKIRIITPTPAPTSSKSYSFKPLGPRKSFLNKLSRPTVKFENLTSPTVFFAVRATTQHPNHNYNSTSSSVKKDEFPPVIPTVNTLLDVVHSPKLDSDLISSVTQTPDDYDDLSSAESQVKSISITVTPPPHLTFSSTSSTTSTSIPPVNVIPVTKKSVSSSSSSKKRPAPVYRRKTSKSQSNQTVT